MQVGLLGLVELGWMETLSTIEVDEIDFEDYLTCGDRHGKILQRSTLIGCYRSGDSNTGL